MRDVRPRFHLTPPSNWMNDPNGAIYVDGRLHVFYQHNPHAAHWDRIHWGHAVTDDLVTWEHWPVAISPEPDGPDAFGCWSGCTVVDGGVPTIVYTGVVLDDALRRASICLARSADGLRTWGKEPANPVVVGAPPGIAADGFRDPFVWRDDRGWVMLVGAGTDEGAGAVLVYRSADLRTWTYGGPFLSAADLPPTVDAGGPCWECPQLMLFGDAAVLVVSITDPAPDARPSHVIGIGGRLDGDRFVAEQVVRLDAGPDFYAPAAIRAPDGRSLLIGWVPEDPPDAVPDGPPAGRTWAGALSFPRRVWLGEDGDIGVEPVAEIASLRGAKVYEGAAVLAPADPPWPDVAVGHRFELVLSLEPGGASAVGIDLLNGEASGPEARIVYYPDDRRLAIGRRGTVLVGGPDTHNEMVLPADGRDTLEMRVLVDGSIMELFANGRIAATFRLPAIGEESVRHLAITTADGPCRVASLTLWRLERGERERDPA
jgi:beta-fructofuranosidase